MFKNVTGQKLIVFAFDTTTSAPKTGDAANLTAYVSKDYGSVTPIGDTSATEMDNTNAKGYYLFDLTQSETNADTLLFSCKSATGSVSVIGAPSVVFPVAANFSSLSVDSNGRVDAIKIAGTTQTARDIGASVLLSSGTGAGQILLSSGLVALAATEHAAIADDVLDEAISGHLTAGTVGAAINAAGSAGDPWATDLPGSYTGVQAGKIVGDNVNATISSRLASASYTAPPTAADNAAELLDTAAGVETSWSVRQALRVMLGVLAGKLSGAATTTVAIRNPEDNKTRVTATVDADGNRSAVTYDKT